MTKKENVEKFLSEKHIAVAGVSRAGNKFGNSIYDELKKKNYLMFQVNPHADEINGDKCFRSIADLPGDVNALVLSTKPGQSLDVVREAHSKGIKNIWMLMGTDSEEALKYCEENDLNTVYNQCILMYANPEGFHKFHGWIWKLIGKYAK